MIEEIIQEVDSKIGERLANSTNVDRQDIPDALSIISTKILKKAKHLLENEKLMELKNLFASEKSEERDALIQEMKDEIHSDLKATMNTSDEDCETLTHESIPAFIQIAKVKLLGSDRKIGFMDFPKLLSFIKSEGKEAKPAGLGGLFGF